MEPTTDKKSNGALIGSVIIIIILLIGGIYLWSAKVEETNKIEEQNVSNNGSAAAIEAYTNLTDLEREVNNTNTDVSTDIESVE